MATAAISYPQPVAEAAIRGQEQAIPRQSTFAAHRRAVPVVAMEAGVRMEEAAEPWWVPRSRWKGVQFAVMLAEAVRGHPQL